MRAMSRLLAVMAIFYGAGVGNGECVMCELLDSLAKIVGVLVIAAWAWAVIVVITS